jgi:ubiquinone/menaquinone biosynthesis C-methylase UbiE
MKEAEQRELVRDRFTKTAANFSDFVLTQRTGQAERLAELATAGAVDCDTWSAVDLACGPGTFTRSVGKRVRHITGLDFTPAMLARARSTVSEVTARCGFVCGDANRLPFGNASLDLVTCGYSIHHMMHAAEVIAGIARVLRPGGRVALQDIVVPAGASQEANTSIERARDPSHTETQYAEELRALLEGAGLHVRSAELIETPREFDGWMRVVNAAPGTPLYVETRRLLEATIEDDAAGMHPRRTANGGLEFTITTCAIVGEKI